MKYSIEEQKEYLFKTLKIEKLRNIDGTQVEIGNFVQATMGSCISDYLKNSALQDDNMRNTKVFLIRDQETNQVAFYFAINCGILFEEYNPLNLEPNEIKPFNDFVMALQKMKTAITDEDKDEANEAYSNSMGDLWEIVGDSDRVTNLTTLATEQVSKLEEKKEINEMLDDNEHIQPVKETYPAIDIKFLCRNAKYKPKIALDFKLGIYVFWEKVVPHLLAISDMVGCRYVYLFAADNTEILNDSVETPMWSQDYDPDECESNKKSDVRKLVSYYINDLKFRKVLKYKILKPDYERSCFTLLQEVDQLQQNRELVWQSHSEEKY